jgi:hypothetical protein
VHAYGVCDDEDYFYDFIQGILNGLGATSEKLGAHSCWVQFAGAWREVSFDTAFVLSQAGARGTS